MQPSRPLTTRRAQAICRDEGAVQHSADLWAGLCKGISGIKSRHALLTGCDDFPNYGAMPAASQPGGCP